MTRLLSVSNRKGGSGKTTTTVNVAAGLAHRGHKVLVIDADPQAHTTLSFGLKPNTDQPDLWTFLAGNGDLHHATSATYLDTLKLIRGSRRLLAFEHQYRGNEQARTLLARRVQQLADQFEYVIVDTPPTLGLLTVSALIAADEVLIPMQTHFLSLEGLAEIVTLVRKIKARYNPRLRIGGVLPTFFQQRTCLSQLVMKDIEQSLGTDVLLHPVRANIALAEAPGYGKTIFQYDERSNGASDYQAVAAQIEAAG